MKKSFLGIFFALLMLCAVSVSAESFNNEAFIGEWKSSPYSDSDYAVLNIDYCSTDTINARFTRIQNGEQKFDYTLYQGTMAANEAVLPYDAYAHGGNDTVESGTVSLALYVDNIWISIYADDGHEVYNGMVKNTAPDFNPYKTPFSSDVHINLNGSEIELSKAPAIINGRTFVPLRGTFDCMNTNVYWDEFTLYSDTTQMITAAKGSDILEIKRKRTPKGNMPWHMRKWTADAPDTIKNDYTDIDISETQPIIFNGSTYVPLRIIAESFGADVQWIADSRSVEITCDISCDTKKTDADTAQIESFNVDKAYNNIKSFFDTLRCTDYPYYTYKSKYYVFKCTRSGQKIYAVTDNSGNTLEYTEEEWNMR